MTHSEARRQLHTAADGPLDLVEGALLDAHLAECAGCRAYAAELRALEGTLARAFHARWDSARPSADALNPNKIRARAPGRPTSGQAIRTLGAALGSAALIAFVVWIAGTALNWDDAPAAAPGATAAPTATPIGGGGGLIAFESERSGNREIFVMNPDGSGQRNLTNHPADDFAPAWSPDGQRIAFLSTRNNRQVRVYLEVAPTLDGTPALTPPPRAGLIIRKEPSVVTLTDIFVMNADGSGLIQLTDEFNGPFWWPPLSWSPDGTWLLATNGWVNVSTYTGLYEYADIFRISADGSGIAPLTDDRFANLDPRWSPAGDRIAFLGEGSTQAAVYVINPDGTGLKKLGVSGLRSDYLWEWMPEGALGSAVPSRPPRDTPGIGRINPFSWSPDGTHLAYVADQREFVEGRAQHRLQLLIVSADGVEEQIVYEAPLTGTLSSPTWSPDGRRLAFVTIGEADARGQEQLYVMWADGYGLKRLTDGLAMNGQPSWSPDGEWIAFVSNRSGNEEVYVLNVDEVVRGVDGPIGTRLTRSRGSDAHPVWQP